MRNFAHAFALQLLPFLLLPLMLSTQVLAQVPQQQQQHVCQDDAFRFCQAAIPDHQRIFACLLENRRQLSAACGKLIASYAKEGRRGSARRRGANPDQ